LADDGVALPEGKAVVVEDWRQPVGVYSSEFRRVVAAERAAGVDALVRDAEFARRLHDLLDVDRSSPAPKV
jgi:hypothetical protein